MNNLRRNINHVEKELLFSQVDGMCPYCANSLIYSKNGSFQKKYELAHIYPLNPSQQEINLLKDEPKLSDDVNALDNLIPLCLDCHKIFDTPRTLNEYRELYILKKKLIEDKNISNLYQTYTISEEIVSIINFLSTHSFDGSAAKLEYIALKVDQKLKVDFNPVLKKHIIFDVTEYYQYIKKLFAELEMVTPGKFDLIAGHIKIFYLNMKLETTNQELIFNKMAEWLYARTKQGSIDSCKVIIAFFIQNCEVFDYVAQ